MSLTEMIVELSKKIFSSSRLKSKKKKRPTKSLILLFERTNKVYKHLSVSDNQEGKGMRGRKSLKRMKFARVRERKDGQVLAQTAHRRKEDLYRAEMQKGRPWMRGELREEEFWLLKLFFDSLRTDAQP